MTSKGLGYRAISCWATVLYDESVAEVMDPSPCQLVYPPILANIQLVHPPILANIKGSLFRPISQLWLRYRILSVLLTLVPPAQSLPLYMTK